MTEHDSLLLDKRGMAQVPDEILLNEDLNEALKVLPANYNFEVHRFQPQTTFTGYYPR